MRIKYIISKDKRSESVNQQITEEFPQFLSEENPELILLSGGDGAMMHAVKEYNHFKVPFLGIARGTFNFLTNEIEDLHSFLSSLSAGEIKIYIQKTRSLKVQIQKDQIKDLGYSVNDIVLGTSIMGFHTFKISTQDKSFDNFEVKGSGICIATDLGSTGYNFNLGSPIIPLGSNLYVLSGIGCDRPINDVLSYQDTYLTLGSSRESCDIYIDGIKQEEKLDNGEMLLLTTGEDIQIGFTDILKFKQKRIGILNRHRKGF